MPCRFLCTQVKTGSFQRGARQGGRGRGSGQMAIAAQRQGNGWRVVACRLLCALAMLVVAGQGVHAQTPARPPQGQVPAVPQAQVFYAPAESLTATVARLGGDPRPQSTE